MTRALVTGATGFIGNALVRALVERGDEVTCLVRPTSNRSGLEELGVRFALGDVTDGPSVQGPAAEADVVYHLAALLKMPWLPEFRSANVEGASNVAAACARAPRPPVLVVVSSLAAAGSTTHQGRRTEEEPPAPASLYGQVKLAADEAVAAHGAQVPITIVRPPMVFGPGDKSVLKLFRMAAKGWHVVPGFRNRRISGIHVADLAQMLILAAQKGERVGSPDSARAGRGVYFVSHDTQPTFADFGRMIGAALGRPRTRVIRIPDAMTWTAALVAESVARIRKRPTILNLDKARESRAGSWVCSASKAKEHLGFEPAASMADRLVETGSWYRHNGLL